MLFSIWLVKDMGTQTELLADAVFTAIKANIDQTLIEPNKRLAELERMVAEDAEGKMAKRDHQLTRNSEHIARLETKIAALQVRIDKLEHR